MRSAGQRIVAGMNALDVRGALLKNLPDDRYVGRHAYWNSAF